MKARVAVKSGYQVASMGTGLRIGRYDRCIKTTTRVIGPTPLLGIRGPQVACTVTRYSIFKHSIDDICVSRETAEFQYVQLRNVVVYTPYQVQFTDSSFTRYRGQYGDEKTGLNRGPCLTYQRKLYNPKNALMFLQGCP